MPGLTGVSDLAEVSGFEISGGAPGLTGVSEVAELAGLVCGGGGDAGIGCIRRRGNIFVFAR